jgi:catechol 2,3-dioxygenase-like lactoylglutathione lyase family enzyme
MIQKVNHVSVTVRDLDKVVAFFKDHFRLTNVWPPYEYQGETIDKVTGLTGAHLRVRKVEVGDFVLEFIQYLAPPDKELKLNTNDVGCPHIGFLADDIEEMYKTLAPKGVKFKSPPQWNTDGSHPMYGWGIVYLWGPENLKLELTQAPS